MSNLYKVEKTSGFFNQRKKFYLSPSGELIHAETLTFPTLCFNPSGLVQLNKNACSITASSSPAIEDGEGLAVEPSEGGEKAYIRGRKRSRRRFFDLVQCNWEFDCMVTLTVDPGKADRTSYTSIMHQLNYWLSNRVARNGLKYVLTPEYHKDGEAIHFHGFMNREALKLKDSGHKHKGRRVYNILDYALGFSTCVKLDDMRQFAAWYCYKYITKADEKIGGRYMLTGGKLRKPIYEYSNEPYDEAVGEVVTVADGLACKIDTPLTF